jgi:DNA primase
MRVKVVRLTGAKDPDEFAQKYGKDKLIEALDSSVSHVAFKVGLLKNKYDLNADTGKIDFTTEAASLLAALPGAIERDVYTKEVAKLTGVSEEAIKAQIAKSSRRASNINDKRRQNFNLAQRGQLSKKSLPDARKGLLMIAANDAALCETISKAVEPTAWGDPVYTRLLSMFSDIHAARGHIYEADIISCFESAEDQKSVAYVFTDTVVPSDPKGRIQAVNEHIHTIRKDFLEKKVEKAKSDNDFDEAERFQTQIMNLPKLYISL